MNGKREQSPDYVSFSNLFKRIIEKYGIGIYSELHTVPGKINVFFDIVLAIIIVITILGNSASAIVRIVSSIFNPALTPDTGDASIFMLLLFLVVFWIICTLFMILVEHEWSKKTHSD